MAGIIVEHKESGVRFAISERNFNDKVHKKVRDLKPGETVVGYAPRRRGSLSGEPTTTSQTGSASDLQDDPGDSQKDPSEDSKTTHQTGGPKLGSSGTK